jgi:hypothetical protein
MVHEPYEVGQLCHAYQCTIKRGVCSLACIIALNELFRRGKPDIAAGRMEAAVGLPPERLCGSSKELL